MKPSQMGTIVVIGLDFCEGFKNSRYVENDTGSLSIVCGPESDKVISTYRAGVWHRAFVMEEAAEKRCDDSDVQRMVKT